MKLKAKRGKRMRKEASNGMAFFSSQHTFKNVEKLGELRGFPAGMHGWSRRQKILERLRLQAASVPVPNPLAVAIPSAVGEAAPAPPPTPDERLEQLKVRRRR